jgi:hypothetical protein
MRTILVGRSASSMSKTRDGDVPLLKGSIVRKRVGRVKSVYLDISFPDSTGPTLSVLSFQNYYCSSVSISQHLSADEFVPVLEHYSLMRDAHCESEAQRWHLIPCSAFNTNYVPWRTLRIFFYQPDAMWQKYELLHISASSVDQDNKSLDSGKSITENAGGSVLSTIGANHQKLVDAALTQVARAQPEIAYTLAEYRKALKKKEKKGKKGAAAQLAVTNDEFGISIPDFSKNEDIP